jgi:hypothetical protein
MSKITRAYPFVVAAALGIAVPARAQGAPPADKSIEISEEARKHFKAGVAFLQDPDGARYEEAYAEFKTAFAASPSPKILGNIGLCAMKLERDGEAIEAYTRYLREVPDIDPDERNQIVQDLQTLQVSVVRLTLTVDPPAASIIDRRVAVRGDKVTNVYPVKDGKVEIGVRPGHHEITARAPGYDDVTWEIDAYGGTRETHAFQLKPKSAPPALPVSTPDRADPRDTSGESRSALPLVIAGIGGAMLVGGTVTGFVALGKKSDLEKSCPNDVCPATFDLASERSSTKTIVGVTDFLLIGGAIVTVGGLAWWFLDKPSAEAKPGSAPPSAGFACTGAGCYGSMRVSF